MSCNLRIYAFVRAFFSINGIQFVENLDHLKEPLEYGNDLRKKYIAYYYNKLTFFLLDFFKVAPSLLIHSSK